MILSVVIPNFNGLFLLDKNLPRIIEAIKKRLKNSEFEIVIVDDASTDGSSDFVRSFFSSKKFSGIKFILINNEKNIGFAASVNKGVDNTKGEILLLLNTDVSPESDFLKPLISHFQDDKVFAAGCMDKSIENGQAILRGRGLGKWSRGFLLHRAGSIDASNTLWVSGGSGAFRKKIWDMLGGFNELYSPFYWEDIDLSYRALKSGYKVMFEPKSIVVHEHEKGSIRSLYTPSIVRSIAYRNQFIFVWENITDFDMILSHICWLPFNMIGAILRLDIRFFSGFFKALILLPLIIKKRGGYKKMFVAKDKEIIAKFN